MHGLLQYMYKKEKKVAEKIDKPKNNRKLKSAIGLMQAKSIVVLITNNLL